jgi:hypothetical protein
LANRFVREIPGKGKSENSLVFTSDLNGGPGWTSTTDLALIRIAVTDLAVPILWRGRATFSLVQDAEEFIYIY